MLDIGGSLGGYGSDITRTLWVTGGDPGRGPDERFRALFAVLRGAQADATGAVRPGTSCESIDAAAREPIERAGFGDAFFHRTGHGIGLEGHEEPYLVAGNGLPLRPGMAFSVEPGIYLPGTYGARIEDIVVCGEDGPDRAQRGAAGPVRGARLNRGAAAPAVSSAEGPYPNGHPIERDPMPSLPRRRTVAAPIRRDARPAHVAP